MSSTWRAGQWRDNWLYEFLSASRHGGAHADVKSELVTVTRRTGSERGLDEARSGGQTAMRSETLWYRRGTGGTTTTYIRRRPRANLAAVLNGLTAQALPAGVANLILSANVQVWVFRPTLSLGVAPVAP